MIATTSVLSERLRRAWTQQQLADFAQVSLSSIQRAEKGVPLRVDICQRICRCLGVERPEELGLQVTGDIEDNKSSSQVTESKGMNRRQALQFTGGIGAALIASGPLFGVAQLGQILHDEEVLSICSTYIPICWRLYFDGHLSEVERTLPGYLSPLVVLARENAFYQKTAATLASKAHQLACMLAVQHQDYGSALIHAEQAFLCANIAEDANLQVASLIRKALVYRYLQRPKSMLEAYQEAVQYSKKASPLLRGRLYTGLAEAHSKFGEENESLHSLELAYKTFPDNPKEDPNFAHTHFKLPQGFEVVMYLNLKQPDKALEASALVNEAIPMAVIPDRVELSIDQARAFFLLGDLNQCSEHIGFAAMASKMLNSNLRYSEAHSLYQQVLMKWPHEQSTKMLTEQFQLN